MSIDSLQTRQQLATKILSWKEIDKILTICKSKGVTLAYRLGRQSLCRKADSFVGTRRALLKGVAGHLRATGGGLREKDGPGALIQTSVFFMSPPVRIIIRFRQAFNPRYNKQPIDSLRTTMML